MVVYLSYHLRIPWGIKHPPSLLPPIFFRDREDPDGPRGRFQTRTNPKAAREQRKPITDSSRAIS